MANVNPIQENTNISQDASNSQINYIRENATQLGQLLDIFSRELQELETNAVIPLLYNRTIDTAVGAQLDLIGGILQVPRQGLTDNQYRVLIRLQAFSNQTNGTVDDLLNLIFFGVGDRQAIYSKGLEYNVDIAFTVCPDRSLTLQTGNPPFGFLGNTEARGYSVPATLTGGQMSSGVAGTQSVNDIILDTIKAALPAVTSYKIINKPTTFFGLLGNPFSTGYSAATARNFTFLDRTLGSYYSLPTIILQTGDVVSFRFQAPTVIVSADQYLIDGDSTGDGRSAVILQTNGTISFGVFNWVGSATLDGQVIQEGVTTYPLDGQVHTVSATLSNPALMGVIGADNTGANGFTGRIYDVGIRNSTQQQRFQYFLNEDWTNSLVVKNSATELGIAIAHDNLSNTAITTGSTTLTTLSGAITTDWIPVTTLTSYIVTVQTGTASGFLWQYSTDGGTTVLFGGANFMIDTIPQDATDIRIYFKTPTDTALAISIRQADGYGRAINITNSLVQSLTVNNNGGGQMSSLLETNRT